MAYFKAQRIKVKGADKYIPTAVVMGKPVSTEQVAAELAKRSTVSQADCFAVLKDMGDVLATFMAQGKSVRLEGIGTFRLTIDAEEGGQDTPEKVSATQIARVRVRFLPETRKTASGAVTTRAGVAEGIEWVRVDGVVEDNTGTGGEVEPGGEDPMG